MNCCKHNTKDKTTTQCRTNAKYEEATEFGKREYRRCRKWSIRTAKHDQRDLSNGRVKEESNFHLKKKRYLKGAEHGQESLCDDKTEEEVAEGRHCQPS